MDPEDLKTKSELQSAQLCQFETKLQSGVLFSRIESADGEGPPDRRLV